MSRIAKGGLIDRSKVLDFRFDGKAYRGFAGDTLASALLANDVKLVGRSFKYHRPRGIFTAGSEEPNALVALRTGARREPNTRATVAELYDGLEAFPQNASPSLKFDVMAVNQCLSRFIGAGFYYKTFMWPAKFWEKLYEPVVRGSAGLGIAPDAPDPDRYEKASAFCDVLVIGSGPAGLTAALSAGRAGARVILADEDFLFGGRLNSEKAMIGDKDGVAFAAAALDELKAMPNVRLMSRTTVFGVYDDTYGAVERVSDHLAVPPPFTVRERLWRITPKQTVLAAGAIDRPIVFTGNDKPGVMLAASVETYVNRYAAAPARRMAFFTSSDGGWTAAFAAADAGIAVPVIVDPRAAVAETLVAEAKRRGIRTVLHGAVVAAKGGMLDAVTIRTAGGCETVAVDGLAVSGGFSPNVQLACHHRGRPVWREDIGALVADKGLPPKMRIAGAAAGSYALSACLADGATAGAAASADAGFVVKPMDVPAASDGPTAVKAFWHVQGTAKFAFVDLQTDVSVKDIKIAAKEGFRSVEHLKRYTALGMGADQGKTSNFNGLAIMAEMTGRTIAETGTTIYRPPYTPVAMGAFAGIRRGRDFRPTRLTPTHFWAEKQGAVFSETGMWLRARYFPRPGETMHESARREAAAVRKSVGMIDVSTFGKIDLQGPDVGKFLDRVYVNTYSKVPVGKARYGVMLREDGMVMDDGTTAHLKENHWVMTTTTVHAVKVFSHLEFCLQVLWPDLDVRIASISEQWAQIALAGPNARKVLQKILDEPARVANDVFPAMGAIETTALGGIAARVFRFSFSGELGFEVAVPARYGEKLAEAMMAAGKEYDITPYGTEALAVMRIEKGHVSGPEVNGQTTVGDLGMGRMASKKKDYIGRVMAERPGLVDEARMSYIGVKPLDKSRTLRAGTHLLPLGAKASVENDLGYLSSATFSPALGHAIAVGFLKGGGKHIGERLRAYDPVRGGDTEVEVCSPYFFDPEGDHLRV